MTDEKDMRNSSNLKDAIRKAFGTTMDVRDERIDLNEKMKDARETMAAAGVPPKVFAWAQSYLLMTGQDREICRELFETICEVLDEDFQPTLFDAEKAKKRDLNAARKARNEPQETDEEE